MRRSKIGPDQACEVETMTQERPSIGHNNPPGPLPFGLGARWLQWAQERELRRLAKLHLRIDRKERALAELRSERTKIMNRCIRRMRRHAGKT